MTGKRRITLGNSFKLRCAICGETGISLWRRTNPKEQEPEVWICETCRAAWL